MGLSMDSSEVDGLESDDDSTTIEYEIEVIESSSSVSLSLASGSHSNLHPLDTTGTQFYVINQIEDETVDEEPIKFLVIDDQQEDMQLVSADNSVSADNKFQPETVAGENQEEEAKLAQTVLVEEDTQQVNEPKEDSLLPTIPTSLEPQLEVAKTIATNNDADRDVNSVVATRVSDLIEAVEGHQSSLADQASSKQVRPPKEEVETETDSEPERAKPKPEPKPPPTLIHLSEQTKFIVTEDNPRAVEPIIIKDSYRWPAKRQAEAQQLIEARTASNADKVMLLLEVPTILAKESNEQKETESEQRKNTFSKSNHNLEHISWKGPHLEDYGFIGEAISVCVYDNGEVNQWPMLSPMNLDPSMFDLDGSDLERELDEEPEFERRQVEVKRGGDRLRSEYSLGQELGRGKFGTVFRCREAASGREFAAKFVHLRHQEDHEDVMREINIMSLLQHKRLLQLYDAYDDDVNHEICLITELIEGGELFERIIDDDFELTERKAAIFMRQICEGVEYMHSMGIVHLDMKPENILCVSKAGCRIKLIDFGLARQLNSAESLRVMFGTPDFAAPEVLAYDTVSLATDMWSVGVICYVLLSGLSPFMGDNDIETMANVTRATYDFDDPAFDPISDLAKDFIAKLLVKDQMKRLKPGDCLAHPWLQRCGKPLEIARRSITTTNRRQSLVPTSAISSHQDHHQHHHHHQSMEPERSYTLPLMVSLDKRNLKKYVVRRKWHKTVHAIMALGRMGANLRQLK